MSQEGIIMEQQRYYWTEVQDGVLMFCLYLPKSRYVELYRKGGFESDELVTRTVVNKDVVYKNVVADVELTRVYELIKQLPADHVPGAVQCYLNAKKSLKTGQITSAVV